MTDYALEWNDKQIMAAARKGVTAGLRKAGQHTRTKAKARIQSNLVKPGKQRLVRKNLGYKVRARGTSVSALVGVLRNTEAMAVGARLAGGFTGRDRLGRVYRQPPRPWLAPTVESEANTITNLVASGGLK